LFLGNANLSDLPSLPVIIIANCLNFRDLLSFGLSCKAVRNALEEDKKIWRKAIQKYTVCDDLIRLSKYLIENDITFTRNELKLIAFMHYKVRKNWINKTATITPRTSPYTGLCHNFGIENHIFWEDFPSLRIKLVFYNRKEISLKEEEFSWSCREMKYDLVQEMAFFDDFGVAFVVEADRRHYMVGFKIDRQQKILKVMWKNNGVKKQLNGKWLKGDKMQIFKGSEKVFNSKFMVCLYR